MLRVALLLVCVVSVALAEAPATQPVRVLAPDEVVAVWIRQAPESSAGEIARHLHPAELAELHGMFTDLMLKESTASEALGLFTQCQTIEQLRRLSAEEFVRRMLNSLTADAPEMAALVKGPLGTTGKVTLEQETAQVEVKQADATSIVNLRKTKDGQWKLSASTDVRTLMRQVRDAMGNP